MTTKKDKIEDWITKMQIKWETNDKFRLPEVIYETYQKAIQSQKQKIIEEINKTIDKQIESFNIRNDYSMTEIRIYLDTILRKELLKTLGEKEQ